MIKSVGTFCSGEQRAQYDKLNKEFKANNPMPDGHCRDPWINSTKEEFERYNKWWNDHWQKDPTFNVRMCGMCTMKLEEWMENWENFIKDNFKVHDGCDTCKLEFKVLTT